jgi:acetyltransferase
MTADPDAQSGLTQSWPLLHAQSLTLRPLRPDDRELVAQLGQGLSAESRYNRFLGGGVMFTRELLDRLVHVDFSRDLALLAIVSLEGIETPVGVARWARLHRDDRTAEFAIAVADAWQRCGIGRLLLSRLIELGRESSLARLVGDVLATNTGMLRLASRLGFRTESHPESGTLRRIVKDLNEEEAAFVGVPDTEA